MRFQLAEVLVIISVKICCDVPCNTWKLVGLRRKKKRVEWHVLTLLLFILCFFFFFWVWILIVLVNTHCVCCDTLPKSRKSSYVEDLGSFTCLDTLQQTSRSFVAPLFFFSFPLNKQKYFYPLHGLFQRLFFFFFCLPTLCFSFMWLKGLKCSHCFEGWCQQRAGYS